MPVEVKGSGRSDLRFHLDAVDWVDKHHPGLILKFGGHAMAAGLTLTEAGVATFTAAFEAVGRLLMLESAGGRGALDSPGIASTGQTGRPTRASLPSRPMRTRRDPATSSG